MTYSGPKRSVYIPPPSVNCTKTDTQGAQELLKVMVSKAKILQSIARVASVYCRIDYELEVYKLIE